MLVMVGWIAFLLVKGVTRLVRHMSNELIGFTHAFPFTLAFTSGGWY